VHSWPENGQLLSYNGEKFASLRIKAVGCVCGIAISDHKNLSLLNKMMVTVLCRAYILVNFHGWNMVIPFPPSFPFPFIGLDVG